MSKEKVNNMKDKVTAPDRRHIGGQSLIKSVYVYVILVLVIVVLSLQGGELFQRGNFLYWPSFIGVINLSIPVIIISSAFTFIMISGNIDLSVGSMLSLTVVFNAILALNGFGFWPALLLTLVLGIVLGFINGWLVMKLRITPVIATLITMNAYQGLARYLVPKGISAIKGDELHKMPAWMGDFSRSELFAKGSGITWALIITILVIVVLWVVQRRTVLGKYVAAVGGNRTAAELSGINAVKVVWGVYVMLGALSALAGVARASYLTIGEPYTGIGTETQAIIAVLLGGTVFTGGEGSVIKSVIGALIIACLTLGLKTVIEPYWQSLATGVVLVLAVALNHVLTKDRLVA